MTLSAKKTSMVIEVCVDSLESASAAIRGGANRLEVCGNLGLGGGTTPSFGLVKKIRNLYPEVSIMAMVRPRTGDFLYSELEFEVMMEDVRQFKSADVHGVVFGILTTEGSVDVARTRRLAQEAHPLQVCFHRAFDMARDPIQSIRGIASIPEITRVLTSGSGPSAPKSLPNLQQLFSVTENLPLTILPGSGINAASLRPVLDSLAPCGLSEIHLSGASWVDGGMTHRISGMGMGVGGDGEWGVWRTSEEAVNGVRKIVDEYTSA